VHGAGAALGKAAAEMRVVETEVVAQRIKERHVRIGFDRLGLAVHVEHKSLVHNGASSRALVVHLSPWDTPRRPVAGRGGTNLPTLPYYGNAAVAGIGPAGRHGRHACRAEARPA